MHNVEPVGEPAEPHLYQIVGSARVKLGDKVGLSRNCLLSVFFCAIVGPAPSVLHTAPHCSRSPEPRPPSPPLSLSSAGPPRSIPDPFSLIPSSLLPPHLPLRRLGRPPGAVVRLAVAKRLMFRHGRQHSFHSTMQRRPERRRAEQLRHQADAVVPGEQRRTLDGGAEQLPQTTRAGARQRPAAASRQTGQQRAHALHQSTLWEDGGVKVMGL